MQHRIGSSLLLITSLCLAGSFHGSVLALQPSTPPLSLSTIKSTLTTEYETFFSPLRKEIYSPTLQFSDPLTSLSSIEGFEANIGMLAGKGLLGKALFSGGRSQIFLHKIVSETRSSDTRSSDTDAGTDAGTDAATIRSIWTLNFQVTALPWKPTIVISGQSMYSLNPLSLLIESQTDYWDSINLSRAGDYVPASKAAAVSDFVRQAFGLRAVAASAALGEIPFELLRAGEGYVVHRYPSLALKESRGAKQMTPGFVEFGRGAGEEKNERTVLWPFECQDAGEDDSAFAARCENANEGEIVNEADATRKVVWPSKVFAVKYFKSAITGDNVEEAHRALRAEMDRDGLLAREGRSAVEKDDVSRIAGQYNPVDGEVKAAVFIELSEEHPWKL